MQDNEYSYDYNASTDVQKPEPGTWLKIAQWIGEHKVICIVSLIGLPILLVWLGAKIFSKTNTVTVEKLPDPTIMDKYDRIPVTEHSYIDYEYVLKPEYKNPPTA